MKKLLITLLMFFLCGIVSAQFLPVNPTSYGSNNLRGKFKTAILLPTICGAPTFMSAYSVDSTSSAFITDSCNNKAYFYNPKTRLWVEFGASSSTVPNSDSLQHIIGTSYLKNYDSLSIYYPYWSNPRDFLNASRLSSNQIPFRTGSTWGGSTSLTYDNISGDLKIGNALSSIATVQIGGSLDVSGVAVVGSLSTTGNIIGGALSVTSVNSSGAITGTYFSGSGIPLAGIVKYTDTSTMLSPYYKLPSFTSGSVIFSNGSNLVQDNSNLFWDNTSKFLRVGQTTSRSDLQLNISNISGVGHAGISIYQGNQSYTAGAEEATVNFQGVLGNGASTQMGSGNFKWANATPSNFRTVYGIHGNSGASSATDFRIFQDAEILLYGGGTVAADTTFETGHFLRSYGGFAFSDWSRVGSATAPNAKTTGKGIEFFYNGTSDIGTIQSYDRSASAFKPLNLSGSTITLSPQGGNYVYQNTDTVATMSWARGQDNTKLPFANVSGTTNYIPVFSGTSTIVNSSTIYHSGGLTGFGNSNPAYILDATATSNTVGLNIRGRLLDNIGSIRWSDNTNITEYAEMQVNSSNQYLFYNGASPTLRATIGSSGISTTGTVTATSLINSGATATDALMGNGSTQVVTSNAYTPTLTNTTNITSSTLYQATYIRVGNIVTVSIGASVTPTLGASTVLTFTLPFTTSNGTQTAVGGAGIIGNSGSYYATGIVNIVSTTTATVTYISAVTGASNVGFTFQYAL